MVKKWMLTRASDLIAKASDVENPEAKAVMLQTAIDLMHEASEPEEEEEEDEDDD